MALTVRALFVLLVLLALPGAASGARPGPDVLYEPLPPAPELSVQAPFAAAPLLVSGTDAYRRGEYVYQDHLFDDHGADTVPTADCCAPVTGDVRYPLADRYANNAADLVELRVKSLRDAIVYRVTLNTVLERDASVVGIGIDSDRSGGAQVAWPRGAGITSPGLDRFITAWGTGGEVVSLPGGEPVALPDGAVTISPETNQMTIRVPRSLLDPGRATWRHVAGAGLWDGDGWKPVPAAFDPTEEDAASGNAAREAPAVYNLAFRFDEEHGPARTWIDDDPAVGNGVWFENDQAAALGEGTSGRFFADVDFGRLDRKADATPHPPGRTQARIHTSSLAVPEGFHPDAPVPDSGEREVPIEETSKYGGRLQPYIVRLPPPSSQTPGLTLTLHGTLSSHTQFSGASPRFLEHIGDQRNSIVVFPLGRNTLGFGNEHEIFEAWNDVASRFAYDRQRVALAGYSAGGYGVYVLATKYPDLFGRAWPIVAAARLLEGGAPGDGTNYVPMLGNLRSLPVMAWNEVADALAPYIGGRGTQDEMDRLGLRSQLWTFPAGEHLTPAVVDEWSAAHAFLGDARLEGDPSRVDYTIAPITWDAEHGLVADHAHWVSGLDVADRALKDETGIARGSISAVSRAFGEGDPVTEKFYDAYAGPPPGPAAIDGTRWNGFAPQDARNALDVSLENIGRATIAGERARLRGDQPLTVTVTTDHPAVLRIELPKRRVETLSVAEGTHTFTIAPA